MLNGELFEAIECLKCSEFLVGVDVGISVEVKSRINEVGKEGEVPMFQCRWLGMNAKRRLYEGVVVWTALYTHKTRNMRVTEKD